MLFALEYHCAFPHDDASLMTTLSHALQASDMLLIDGLHAFDFTFDETGLQVECMDGRALKRWQFSIEQINAARADGGDWLIAADGAEHRLVCMSALRASEEDDDETSADVSIDQ